MSLQGKSIIGSKVAQDSNETFFAKNPADKATIQPAYHVAGTSDVEEAVRLASEAFPTFSKTTGKERAAFLRKVSQNITDRTADIVDRATKETGLPEARIQGETMRTTGQLNLFADLIEEGSWSNARIEHGDADRQPLPKPDVRSMEVALGPVAVFGASNFPLAFSVAGGDTASALAAGCPVVVKAHSAHPGTSEIVAQAVQKAVQESNLPEGVFSVLFGSGSVIGEQLVKHPGIAAVGFTGSRNVGRHLMNLAAAREVPVPVYAEMSSINPVVFLPEILEEKGEALATALKDSVIMGVGQFCTNPGLIFVEKSAQTTKFIETLKTQIESAGAGTMLTAGIAEAYAKGVEGHLAVTSNSQFGAEAQGNGCCGRAACFVTDGATFLKENQLQSEVFGPSTTVIEIDSKDQMKEIIASLEGQLTGSVHGTDKDLESYRDVVGALQNKVGRLVFNGFPTGVEVCSSIVHGGPYPATSDGRSTSVGTLAIHRFTRTVCFQNCPEALLPEELKETNPLGITRLVDRKTQTN